MVYPRAHRFLCFVDFDIDSLKTSPQDEEIYGILTVHRTFKMKLRNDLMKLIFVFDKSSKIQFQCFIILYD